MRFLASIAAASFAVSALAIGALSYAQSDAKFAATKAAQPGAATPAAPVAANPSPGPSKTLKICADPDNLPQSDQNGAGYENELARALARDLGKPVEYKYFPQRMGFVRNTLKHRDEATGEFECDLIVGVPIGFQPAATTRAYMRSTYALVVPARARLGTLHDPNELLQLPKERLQRLKFGVFAKSPATDWLLRNALMDRATFYATQSGDVTEHPANIIERELTSGAIDVAIVWGPVAGFLASRHSGGPDKWTAVPFKPDPEIHFDYEIAMGVRFGEKEWKSTLDRWITEHHTEIDKILSRYQVPLLAVSTAQ